MEGHTAKHKKIGLALGGGAAKGFAHIGVIKALEKAGIEIEYIAGTSMGALVGGYYAATKDIHSLERLMVEIKKGDFFSARDIISKKNNGGLFKSETIAEQLLRELDGQKIEDCQIPFVAIATDVKNGDEVRVKNGNLADAIKASIAVPLIFSPVEFEEKLLMDGGLVNPVPADAVKEMGAEFVIAIDVSSQWFEKPEDMTSAKSAYSIILQSLSVLEYQLAKNILRESADIVLKPSVFHCDWLDFSRASEIIKIGEETTEIHLREIRQKSGHKKPKETLGEKFLDFIFNKPTH